MAHDYEWNHESFASQKAAVRAYLNQGNTLTALEALRMFGTLRLSAIIFDLREEGIKIDMKRIKTDSGKWVGEYRISE